MFEHVAQVARQQFAAGGRLLAEGYRRRPLTRRPVGGREESAGIHPVPFVRFDRLSALARLGKPTHCPANWRENFGPTCKPENVKIPYPPKAEVLALLERTMLAACAAAAEVDARIRRTSRTGFRSWPASADRDQRRLHHVALGVAPGVSRRPAFGDAAAAGLSATILDFGSAGASPSRLPTSDSDLRLPTPSACLASRFSPRFRIGRRCCCSMRWSSGRRSRSSARKTFQPDEWFFQGHYPDYPLVPGVILCEAAMQAGAVLLSKHMTGDGVPVAGRLNDVKFKRMIRPGDTMLLDVTLDERMGDAFFLSAKVTCDGKPAVTLSFAVTRPNAMRKRNDIAMKSRLVLQLLKEDQWAVADGAVDGAPFVLRFRTPVLGHLTPRRMSICLQLCGPMLQKKVASYRIQMYHASLISSRTDFGAAQSTTPCRHYGCSDIRRCSSMGGVHGRRRRMRETHLRDAAGGRTISN